MSGRQCRDARQLGEQSRLPHPLAAGRAPDRSSPRTIAPRPPANARDLNANAVAASAPASTEDRFTGGDLDM